MLDFRAPFDEIWGLKWGGLGAYGNEITGWVETRAMDPHTGTVDKANLGEVSRLAFLGEPDDGLEDDLDTVGKGGKVDDDFDVLSLDGFNPGSSLVVVNLHGANNGDDFVGLEEGFLADTASCTIDNVVGTAELL
jgi:hypothetical protein